MIQNWKQAYKFASVQLAVLVAIIAGIEPFFPVLSENLPDGWASAAAVLIVVARLIQQKSLETSTPQSVWDEAMRMRERAKK